MNGRLNRCMVYTFLMQMYWIAPEQKHVLERPLLAGRRMRAAGGGSYTLLFPPGLFFSFSFLLFYFKSILCACLSFVLNNDRRLRYVFGAKFRAPNDTEKSHNTPPPTPKQ